MRFAPSLAWDPKVASYFEDAFGPQKLHRISESLCKPSLRTCLRVNTRQTTAQVVLRQLKQLFPHTQPYIHPILSSAVIMPGTGPLQPDYQICGGQEVLINRYAGESVLKGANVFAPGLLAATPGIAADDMVAVSVAVGQAGRRWCGVNRGMSLTQNLKQQLLNHDRHYIGVGRVTAGRRGLFRSQEGLAVEMVQRVFEIPPCNGVLRGQVMLQALPSIAAAHALNPQPGSRVLDMCAAPGGKSTMFAQMMGDSGSVIALDRTQAKVQEIQTLASDWGLNCLQAYAVDATQLYQQEEQQQQQWISTPDHTDKDTCSSHQHQQPCVPRAVECHPDAHEPNAAASTQDSTQDIPGSRTRSDSAVSRTTAASAIAASSSSSAGEACTSSRTSVSCTRSSNTRHCSKRRRINSFAATGLPPEVLAAVQANSFDAVLLDAPCSALGLRPRLSVDWSLPALDKLAAYQRALLHSAVHVLKPGGCLVYCTCTINPGENEANVRYVLDKWPHMAASGSASAAGRPRIDW